MAALPLCLAAETGQPAPPALVDLMDKAEIPGLAIARIEDGELSWSYALGLRDNRSKAPVTEDTVFEAASLSKPVVAYLTLRLVARGVLELDAPLWDEEGYERLSHDPRAREITARMVLTHTSGLPNWGGTPLQMNHDPGTRWGYSGEGFVFLATMLERRTGKTLNDLAKEEVFEPLGMSASSFIWTEAYDQTSASPHDLGGQPTRKGQPESANAAASLHTTAQDYARFLLAVMAGEGLPKELAGEMVARQSDIGGWGDESTWPYLGWTLGWGFQQGDDDPAIWHWGDNGNFRCFVLAYPGRKAGLVYFTNTSLGLSITEDVLDLAFDDTYWSVRYLDYSRWDAPRFQARKALRRAATEFGDEAFAAIEGILSELPEATASNEAQRVGSFLVEQEDFALASLIADWGVDRFGGADWLEGRADLRTRMNDHAGAVNDYEAALKADPTREEALAPRLAWLQSGLVSAAKSYQPDTELLDDYVGRFGPRVIRRTGEGLTYARQGTSTERPLRALDKDVFFIEGVHWFRLRFNRDASGRVTSITGLYSDGRSDETARSD